MGSRNTARRVKKVGAVGIAGSAAGDVNATGMRFAIVAARFNEHIVTKLLDGARATLTDNGADPSHIDVYWVAGAFELPVVAERIATRGTHDAIIALGCVVRGDTPHFEYVAGAAATGLEQVARAHQLPVTFGVLTTNTFEQAEARAGGSHSHAGVSAALTAIQTANLLKTL